MAETRNGILPGLRPFTGLYSVFFEPQLTQADPPIPYLPLLTEPVTESGVVAVLSISIGISI